MKFFQLMPFQAMKMNVEHRTIKDLTPPVKWQIAAIWAIWWLVGVSEGGILLKRVAFNELRNTFQNVIRFFRVAFFVGKVALNPV